jgi:hypothetical protein
VAYGAQSLLLRVTTLLTQLIFRRAGTVFQLTKLTKVSVSPNGWRGDISWRSSYGPAAGLLSHLQIQENWEGSNQVSYSLRLLKPGTPALLFH